MSSIVARFEKQAASTPGHLAIDAGGATLSYRALNEASNRIGHRVAAEAADDTVAVLMAHGVQMVAGMLGVMKAGKIFVPIDPRQPDAKIVQILDGCGANVLLVDRACAQRASALDQRRVKVLDVDAFPRETPTSNPDIPIHGASPACVLYTSGSTGLPKGVVLTHANLLHRIAAYTGVFRLRETDRLTLLAPCAVAQGLSSALQALLNGASVHLFDLRRLGVGELAAWLTEHAITIYVSTASTFRHFAGALTAGDVFPTVRAIRLGSEEILPHDVELYRRHFSSECIMVASLGSTEAGAIAINVIRHDSEITDHVPVGYPPQGVTIRIVDGEGHQCQPGMAGEITVRSAYVSPGYWRDPVRTEAAFADRPSDGGVPFFRTGDLGLMRPDGCIEFLGRKNLCVKIRGCRVELEEIERCLCAHPAVQEAVVVVRQANREDRLAACIVRRNGAAATAGEMKAHLEKTLPEYMVPPTYEFLAALPQTASGKIDRASLSAPSAVRPTFPVDARDPADPVEARLIGLWEELLGDVPIHVTDNFFECGGNSLLAARLGVSIARTFGTKLPLAAFLTAPTIEGQARLLREHRPHLWSSLVPIQTHGSKPPLFCMHLVDGQVLSYRDLIRHLPADQPIYGLQSRGLDGKTPVNTRIEDMARDYVDEIRRFHPSGAFGLCGWSFGGIVAFEVARQFERAARPPAVIALLDSRVRRSQRPRRLLSRVPNALLAGRAGWRRKIGTARLIVSNAVWRHLVRWHRAGGWLPRSLQNVTHANRNARRDYVPGPYGGRVILFGVSNINPHRADARMAWAPLSPGGLEVHDVSGTHRTMVFEPHVRALAEKLAQCLDKAWSRATANRSASGGDRAA